MNAMESPAAGVTVDALLVHREFLSTLARGLLSDPNAADDVAQQTWLAAVRHPPANDHNVKGWLRTVARRFAVSDARARGGRRRREEAVARPEAVPSAADIAHREAVRREVVDAVLALDPTYRDPIVLRYLEDLPPREIASRLDLPVETVRTRIKRGLERLRARLDDVHQGRDAWAVALAPIAWPKATAGGATLGGIKALFVAAAAAVLVPSAVLLWPRDEASPPASPSVAHLSPAAVIDDAAVPSEDATTSAPTDDAVRAAAETSPAPYTLRGVVFDPTGEPAFDARVSLVGVPFDPTSMTRRLIQVAPDDVVHVATRTDAEGRFLTEPAPGIYEVIARTDDAIALGGLALVGDELLDHAETARLIAMIPTQLFKVRSDAPAEAELDLETALPVSGRVVDVAGRPIASAEVGCVLPTVLFGESPLGFGDRLAVLGPLATTLATDAEGAFALPALHGASLGARKDGFFATRRGVSQADRDLLDARLVLTPHPSFPIAGRVVDPDGTPVGDAEVFLGHADESARNTLVDLGYTLQDEIDRLDAAGRPRVRSGADGRFHFDDAALLDDDPWAEAPDSWHGAYRLSARHDNHLPARGSAFTPTPEGTSHDLVVMPRLAIAGQVVDAIDKSPIDGARVTIQYDVHGDGFPYAVDHATTAADGRFALSGPRKAPIVRVDRDGYQTWYDRLWVIKPEQAGSLRVEMKPTTAELTGQVVDPAGQPLGRSISRPHDVVGQVSIGLYDLYAWNHDPRPSVDIGRRTSHVMTMDGTQARFEAEGRFTFPEREWPGGVAWLVFVVHGKVAEVRSARPEEGPVTLTVDPANVRFSTVSLRGVDERGEPIGELSFDVFTRGLDEPITHAWWSNGGVATATIAEPGTYDVVARAPGFGRTTVPVAVQSGVDVGPLTVTLSPGLRLRGRVVLSRDGDDVPIPALIRVCDARGYRVVSNRTTEEGTFEVDQLRPGRYFVEALGTFMEGRAARWVDVGPSTAELEFTLDDTTWAEIDLDELNDERLDSRFVLRVFDSQGTRHAWLVTSATPGDPTRLFLPVGAYTLVVERPGAARIEMPFAIDGPGATVVTPR